MISVSHSQTEMSKSGSEYREGFECSVCVCKMEFLSVYFLVKAAFVPSLGVLLLF